MGTNQLDLTNEREIEVNKIISSMLDRDDYEDDFIKWISTQKDAKLIEDYFVGICGVIAITPEDELPKRSDN
ncbi:hypothetical protein [Pseudanabaena sp. 'Roaring Creek']|uniref:hypothetical protein n=1 Tax=Pseudanabaena sp. 'Roaring Creek' TaxID=1681830 RepID=UPI0006D79C55|nr:hypothetical protein [Pseudanabaena sp. 'Roaring Creek']